jgi:hypothetical protein
MEYTVSPAEQLKADKQKYIKKHQRKLKKNPKSGKPTGDISDPEYTKALGTAR